MVNEFASKWVRCLHSDYGFVIVAAQNVATAIAFNRAGIIFAL